MKSLYNWYCESGRKEEDIPEAFSWCFGTVHNNTFVVTDNGVFYLPIRDKNGKLLDYARIGYNQWRGEIFACPESKKGGKFSFGRNEVQ